MRWTKSWSNCWAERAVITLTKSALTTALGHSVQYCLTSSLVMWVMGQNPSARLQMNQVGGEVNDAPAGCAVTQQDLSWLEKWAESNLVRFSKRNLAVLCLGRCYPMHQRGLGIKQWESSFAEEPPWGWLGDKEFTLSQQSTLMAKASSILGCVLQMHLGRSLPVE